MRDWQLKKLSEDQIKQFRVHDKDAPLTRSEKVSLFSAKTPLNILEKEAAAIFELEECDSEEFACAFVADEFGVEEKTLRPQEVLLAIHYIFTFGGGYNKKLGKLVFKA